jgi:hypothetical protein
MKTTLLVGALGLVALAGCADLTKWTGLSLADQQCIATAAVAEAQKDTAMVDKVAAVEAACGVDRNALIETAIKAAMEAVE